jgi:hypothetical protein
VDRHLITHTWPARGLHDLPTKHDAPQQAVGITERKVDVPLAGLTEIGNLAFKPEIAVERISFERFPEQADNAPTGRT